MNCPKCNEFLPRLAQSCTCGWKKTESSGEALPWIDCAHAGCRKPAVIRQKIETGWAKLCYDHYAEHHHAEATQRVHAMGLTSVAECREWLKMNKLRDFRVIRAPEKVGLPGEPGFLGDSS